MIEKLKLFLKPDVQGSSIRPFTVAGAAQVRNRSAGKPGWPGRYGVDFLLLPVELQSMNHTASTNRPDSTRQNAANPTIPIAMSNQNQTSQIGQITERVERLLLRHEELLRTNAELGEQVSALTHERDSLRSRLSAARARVDALIERLPESSDAAVANTPVSPEL